MLPERSQEGGRGVRAGATDGVRGRRGRMDRFREIGGIMGKYFILPSRSSEEVFY